MWKALINLIEKWGCKHDYKLEFKTEVHDNIGQEYQEYFVALYKCKKCGNFTKVRTN